VNLVCPCGVSFESGVPRRKFCDPCRETPRVKHGNASRTKGPKLPETRTCNRCRAIYQATADRLYCDACRVTPAVQHRNAHRTGTNASTARLGMFIGIDGEGYTRPDGTHHYTMLSVGDRTLTDPNGDALDARQIFPFLWECFEENPDATYVGFHLGYDFWQWLASLPAERGWRLLHKEGIASRRRVASKGNTVPYPVKWRGWQFDLLGRVRFRLKHEDAKQWMYINDCGPYFQGSFMKIIAPSQWPDPVCSQAEYDTLSVGKAARADTLEPFQYVAGYEETIRYNRTENRILAVVMDRLKAGMVAEGILLERDQWYGPGQAAQTWLDVQGYPRGLAARSTTPEGALEAAQASYYGGLFEIFAHGHLAGETYEYDLNSAYPAAMTHLPCPVHGSWRPRKRPDMTHPYTLCHVRVSGSHDVAGAMQCRRPDGTIARPQLVQGWYWAHELAAAKRAGFVSKIEHIEAWQYTPAKCPGMMEHEGKIYRCGALPEAVAAAYERRKAVGKNTAHGKALKIVLNSIYGKFAQSIGRPRYGNAFSASFITSWCRTQILDAIATHPNGAADLVMLATDGIYFRTPHPSLSVLKDQLGAWEMKTISNLTLLKPGVYWDDASRARLAAGELPALKSRGIAARDLAANILRLDEEFSSPEFLTGKHWPVIRMTKNFNLISGKTAITRGKWELCGQIEWAGGVPHAKVTREEAADPTSKRDTAACYTDHRGDLRTRPLLMTSLDATSVPYSEAFGRRPEEDPRFEEMFSDTPDGPDDYTELLTGES
jgi:hypothetical protein